jgi:inner membrane protein
VDNITHSLFALTLANTGLRRAGRGATAALVIASNIPDIEVLTTLTGGRVGYLAAHRGPTHGLFGLGLGLATGLAVWLALRASGRRDGSASLPALAGLSMVGVAGHVAMDFATSYGTRILSPFDRAWYGVDWMPIVDLFLWVVLTAGAIGAAVRPELRARLALSALVLAGGDYAVRAAAHGVALDRAVAVQAEATAAPVARPGPAFHYLDTGHPAALPAALPTWGSPFRWRLITRTPRGFEVRTLDLFDRSREGDAIDFPSVDGALVARASRAQIARVFLDFSRFPAADQVTHQNGDVTVHWYDLRFAEHPASTADGRHYTSPFAVWIRLSPAGAIVGQGLGPG